MSHRYVADVGNTRIKWAELGLWQGMQAVAEDEQQWQERLPHEPGQWLIASVRPTRAEHLARWLQQRGHQVRICDQASQIPLAVAVEQPQRVGVDRLLNALAARRRLRPGESASLIDAGSAVTVDLLDAQHTFRGGVIFPGLDLMAQVLHHYTALLPAVTFTQPLPTPPARATESALQAGIYAAVVGGIQRCVAIYGASRLFLTGGQADLLAPALPEAEVYPSLTLEGIAALWEAGP